MTTKRKPGPSRFVFAATGEAAGTSQAAPADGERNRSIDDIECLSSALDVLPATRLGGGAA